jgi:hypothetical protein
VLADGLDLSLRTGSTHALSMGLGAVAQLALAEGDPERAALIAGAAEGLRVRAGLRVWRSISEVNEQLEALRNTFGADRFDEVYATGSRLSQAQALEAARAATGTIGRAAVGPS